MVSVKPEVASRMRTLYETADTLPPTSAIAVEGVTNSTISAHALLSIIAALPHRKAISIYEKNPDVTAGHLRIHMDENRFTNVDAVTAIDMMAWTFTAEGGMVVVHSYTREPVANGSKQARRRVRGWTILPNGAFFQQTARFLLAAGPMGAKAECMRSLRVPKFYGLLFVGQDGQELRWDAKNADVDRRDIDNYVKQWEAGCRESHAIASGPANQLPDLAADCTDPRLRAAHAFLKELTGLPFQKRLCFTPQIIASGSTQKADIYMEGSAFTTMTGAEVLNLFATTTFHSHGSSVTVRSYTDIPIDDDGDKQFEEHLRRYVLLSDYSYFQQTPRYHHFTHAYGQSDEFGVVFKGGPGEADLRWTAEMRMPTAEEEHTNLARMFDLLDPEELDKLRQISKARRPPSPSHCATSGY